MNHITSTQNALVKRIRSLASKKGRLEEKLFALEGRKLLEEAASSGLQVRHVLAESAFINEYPALVGKLAQDGAEICTVERAVLESAADTRTPSGVIAAVKMPDMMPPEQYADGLWVVLDVVQDPGNLGAILRSADAMGAAGVLLGEGCVDPYSPKAIRSAMGSTFHLPVVETDSLAKELVKAKREGFGVVATLLDGEDELPQALGKTILVIGNEGNGIRGEIAALATIRYRLKMKGRAESLNAAVCAGILLYELSKRMG